MVDEETQDVAAGPAGAPVNRDARPDPGVIEGEIAARSADEAGRRQARPRRQARRRLEPSPRPPPPSRSELALAPSRPARSPA